MTRLIAPFTDGHPSERESAGLAEASKPVNRPTALLLEPWRLGFGRLARLQDDIFSVLKLAALKTLVDEHLDFGSCDLNVHGAIPFLYIIPQNLTTDALLSAARRLLRSAPYLFFGKEK